MSRLHSRIASLASALVLALGAAACSDDVDPLEPGLGLSETGNASGFLAPSASINSFGFAANRTGPVFVRVCGEVNSNLDIAAITNTRTVDGSRVADTLGRSSTSGNACESVRIDATAGTTYRIVVKAAQGFGQWTACYAYTESTCAGLVPFDYYATITPALAGQALIDALATITRTGQRTFAYDSARGWLYQSVEDADSNDVVVDVYAGRSATITNRASAATVSFNTEHAWPQSCGANVEASTAAPNGARGDLHILFASDDVANNRRGNNPFGRVTGTPDYVTTPPTPGAEVSRRGPGAGGFTVFEPRPSRRGDVARAIFYFYVRYASTNPDSTSLANFNREEATLRQWATEDPVDDYERGRNEVIYLVQRNRNPFIDNPALLERITDFPDTLPGVRPACNL